MATDDLHVVYAPDAITLDWLLGPATETDGSGDLVAATVIALCTDRRAKDDDRLPDPDDDDRRGWWADTDAVEIWDGWPIGSRLWLLARAKITRTKAAEGALIPRIEDYVREAIKPFRDQRIFTRSSVIAERTDTEHVDVTVQFFRGDKPEIALRFQSLWQGIQR